MICLAHCCPLSFLSDLDAKAASSAWLLFRRFVVSPHSILPSSFLFPYCPCAILRYQLRSALCTSCCRFDEYLQTFKAFSTLHLHVPMGAHVPLPSFIFVNFEPFLISLHFFQELCDFNILGAREKVQRSPHTVVLVPDQQKLAQHLCLESLGSKCNLRGNGVEAHMLLCNVKDLKIKGLSDSVLLQFAFKFASFCGSSTDTCMGAPAIQAMSCTPGSSQISSMALGGANELPKDIKTTEYET